jgi:hypothetical protein
VLTDSRATNWPNSQKIRAWSLPFPIPKEPALPFKGACTAIQRSLLPFKGAYCHSKEPTAIRRSLHCHSKAPTTATATSKKRSREKEACRRQLRTHDVRPRDEQERKVSHSNRLKDSKGRETVDANLESAVTWSACDCRTTAKKGHAWQRQFVSIAGNSRKTARYALGHKEEDCPKSKFSNSIDLRNGHSYEAYERCN